MRISSKVKGKLDIRFVLCVLSLVTVTCSSPTLDTKANTVGKRCDAKWYNGPSEDPRCYALQKQLFEAAMADDVPEINRSIRDGANVNGGFGESLPVLEGATLEGRNEAINALLDAGAEINKVRSFGETALKSAVFYRHKDTVKLLLKKGADLCERKEGSALEYAIESGDKEMIAILEEAGADGCK